MKDVRRAAIVHRVMTAENAMIAVRGVTKTVRLQTPNETRLHLKQSTSTSASPMSPPQGSRCRHMKPGRWTTTSNRATRRSVLPANAASVAVVTGVDAVAVAATETIAVNAVSVVRTMCPRRTTLRLRITQRNHALPRSKRLPALRTTPLHPPARVRLPKRRALSL